MAGKKDTSPVYSLLWYCSRKSNLILKKKEDSRVVGRGEFAYNEAKESDKCEKFQELGGEAILNKAIARVY